MVDNTRTLIAQKVKTVIKSPCHRVLFVYLPHIMKNDFSVERAQKSRYWIYQPYGPGLLAQSLFSRGYEADIVDLNYEILRAAHDIPENFDYDVWRNKLRENLENFQPDVVGISCMFTMSHEAVKEVAAFIKEQNAFMPVLGGGVHLSNARKLALLDCADLDFIGIYECDKSLPDLLDFVNGKLSEESLSQLATLVNGEYLALENRATPSVAQIETKPLYFTIPVGQYDALGQIGSYGFLRKERKAGVVLTERGCRYHCSFCSVASFNGPGVRERSVLGVVDEIQKLHEVYDIRHIELLDDDFLSKKQRVLDLLNELVRRDLDITWSASNGLVAACITPEIMQAMSESGCIGFNLGIESGNDEILKSVHKPGFSRNFRKAKEIIEKYPHIFVKGFLIIGFPHETIRQLLDTVNLSLELCFDWYPIQSLNPLPSTEIYDFMIGEGLIKDSLETTHLAYVSGPHNRRRLREEREKISAEEFFNLFGKDNPNEELKKGELDDYYFLVDYKVNYEKILGIVDPIKLKKIGFMLQDVKDRIAPENPMAHLFYGIIQNKLGVFGEAQLCAEEAKRIAENNAYWQKRFDALDIHSLIEKCVS